MDFESLCYLDDYVFVSSDLNSARTQKCTLLNTFTRLGIPLEKSKLESPSSCLTFLGMEIQRTCNLAFHVPN